VKKLDKLIIKTFLGPFVITFFVTLFVLVMQFLWKYIDDLVGKGLDAFTVGKLIFYMSATMVPLALPLAILLSSIMACGNMGENFELVALKSAGISLTRFMLPLIIVSFLLSGGAFLFANYVIPAANLKSYSLLYDIVNLKHGFNIRPGIFFTEIDNMAIKVQQKDADGVTIHGIMIYDNRDPGNHKLILAKDGKMEEAENKKYVYLNLYNGWEYEERGGRVAGNNEMVHTSFKDFKQVLDLSSFQLSRTPINLFKSSYQMLNVHQLSQAVDSIQRQAKFDVRNIRIDVGSRYPFTQWKDTGWVPESFQPLKVASFDSIIPFDQRAYIYDNVEMQLKEVQNNMDLTVSSYQDKMNSIIRHKVEWHRKFTLSFACLVLFLIGAPLGSIIRKGGLGTPLVFAVAFFVVFHVVATIGERLARNGVMTPLEGMWLATAVLVPIAVFLIYKALNDSQMFNKEYYFRLFRNLRKLFHR
jgi:lipopolysaccharide export system permease protein